MTIELLAGIVVSNLVVMGIERWFGETDTTEANSIMKFVEGAVIKIVGKLIKRG